MTRTQTASGTDWERLKKMRDLDIDHSDVPPLDVSFFKNAALRRRKQARLLELKGKVRWKGDLAAWRKGRPR
jgi:hypothetical protein